MSEERSTRRRVAAPSRTVRAIARSRGLTALRPRGWLRGTIAAIDAAGHRRDYARRLRAFACLLAGRAGRAELAVLLLLEETAAELGLHRRSISTYRAELERLRRLTTIEEGSTPAGRGGHHPHSGSQENRAAVLAFVEPRKDLAPRSPSVEGDDGEELPYARSGPAAPPQDASMTGGGRRGRSRRLAAELIGLVPELRDVSVRAVATVLRQVALDDWSAPELVGAIRTAPGHQPWLREDEPVRYGRGWLAFRLRPWAKSVRPSLLRRALDGGVAEQRRRDVDTARRDARPAPPEIRALLEARAEARRAAGRSERTARRRWIFSAIDEANPWPASRDLTPPALTGDPDLDDPPCYRQFPGGEVVRVR